MSRPVLTLLLGAAAALAGIIALEITDRSGDDDAVVPAPLRQPAPAPQPAAARPADQAASWAGVALARPLFSPTRRPAAQAEAPVAATPARLPRVAGILISPGDKSVIFAGGAGGKPVVAREGGRVGAYQVQSIEVGRVTVVGPEGVRVLSASFDAAAPARSPAAADQGGLAGLLGGLPGGRPGGLPALPPPTDPALAFPGFGR